MATTTKKNIIPSPQTEQAAVQEIIKLLDESRAPTYMHTFEHFNRVLGIWESALRQDPMAQWLEATRGLEFGLEPLARALVILMEQAAQNYYDIIGSVYMVLGQGEKRFGQVFTPWNVAKLMAEITLADFKPPAPGEPPLTFCEPCVGSGIMILAAADTIEQRFPGTIARGLVEFYGQDKDPCCVTLCRLNMKLHGIGRLVQHIEDLTPQQRWLLERLLGRRLPKTGMLVDVPDIRAGDTLLDRPVPLVEAKTQGGETGDPAPAGDGEVAVVRAPVAAEGQPGPETELIAVPALVAHDLWAALETGNDGQVVQDQAQPQAPRRKGGRGANRGTNEYTPGLLFPPEQPE